MVTITELPESCMAFKLESGQFLFISKADVHSIAMQIIVEGSIKKTTVMIKEKDTSIERADILYRIMKEEKNMNSELRESYLRQISDLLASAKIEYTDLSTGNTVDVLGEKNKS